MPGGVVSAHEQVEASNQAAEWERQIVKALLLSIQHLADEHK